MIKKLILAIALLLSVSSLRAQNNIYIAQTAQRNNTGADCADAYAMTFYNTYANWVGTVQTPGTYTAIGPGTTVHLCGTFTASAGASNFLIVESGGTAGNPITTKFETNALLTAPYWGGPAIQLNHNYLVIDGGTNGTIQATANGTNLTYQNSSGSCVNGVNVGSVEIKNLTCANLYVHVCNAPGDSTCTDANGNSESIFIFNYGSVPGPILIHNNTVHDTAWAITYQFESTQNYAVQIYSNTIYNIDHGVVFAAGGSGSFTGSALIYGNTIHDFQNWDESGDAWHHDGIHVFTGASGESISGLNIFNNYIYGNYGLTSTSGIYVEPAAANEISNFYIFNNLFQNSAATGYPGDAYLYFFGENCGIYNNTVQQTSSTADSGVDYSSNDGPFSGCTVENNVFSFTGTQRGEYIPLGNSLTNSDYNDFYDLPATNAMIYQGNFYSLAGWVSNTGFDTHSITSNPNLTSTGQPNSGSPIIGAGASLYSICNGQANPGLGALCSDIAGTARPSSGAWSIGAYQGAGGSAPVTSYNPTSLSFGNQTNNTSSGAQVITLTNTGTATLLISSIALTTGTQFSQTNTCGAGITAGSNCSISVVFSPTTSGAKTDTVIVTSNAASSPDSIGSSGTGVASAPSTPTLTVAPGLSFTQYRQSATLASSDGTVICYNTTGAPTTAGNGTSCGGGSTKYTVPIQVLVSETLYYVAGVNGASDSSVGSQAFTITASPVSSVLY
jgi:hypothetical protein